MGWEVREGFLEELTWSVVGGNPSGKNNEGQGPAVEMNLSDSRDRREAEGVRLRNLVRHTSGCHTDGDAGLGQGDMPRDPSKRSHIQAQACLRLTLQAEGPGRKNELPVGPHEEQAGPGAPLVAQWVRVCLPRAGDTGLIPGLGGFHVLRSS